ncbi:MAG: multidrug effflux MFS transporter [Pseudoflavonifractor sp.]|nr:multidrug effflux MFS transporter [Alloprevotella sp.]MCM1116774.1 multidrug effflux MFS transporter [Pseudoflavonifractor sp.]
MARRLDADPRYYWFLVIFLVAESALGSMVNDMYSPALPAMTKFYGCSVPLAQVGLTTGMAGLGLGQIILGPLSDHYGRRPILISSALLFIVAAVASIFSPNIHFFNICRLFQGLGASGGYFLARTIPADVYGGRQLAKLMAIVGAINGIAPASAPVIGGIAADTWGWKSVFIILAAFASLLMLSSPLVKESLAPAARTKGPWWHGVRGYGEIIRRRPFMIHVCFKGVSLGLLFAYISSSPFILQNHYGLSQTAYGLVVGVNALFVVAGSLIALRFHPLKRAARLGAIIASVAIAAQGVALWTVHSLWLFEGIMVAALFGLGLIFSTTNSLAMNEGRDKAGEASAVLGVAGYIVGAIVSPLVGIGDILHSTAIAYIALAILILLSSHFSHRLAPDLESN